jgi:hypothetical protein
MEPESSLTHSQVPVTCPYPKPDRFCPCPRIPLHIMLRAIQKAPDVDWFYHLRQDQLTLHFAT